MPMMNEETKSNNYHSNSIKATNDDCLSPSQQSSGGDQNPFEICKDPNILLDDSTPIPREEESEINMLKRFNSSLKKRSDSSNFIPRGGFYYINKRPNSIGGFNSPTLRGY